MLQKARKTKIVLYLGLLMLIFSKPAQAYIDPGTGSYIFQLLAAGLLGSLFFVNIIFKKVKSFFRVIVKKTPRENNENK